MRRLTAWLDRRMFATYTAAPADLAVYRVFYGTYVLLALAPVGLWIRGMPDAFFAPPPGLAVLADGFPPAWVMPALNAALIVAAALLTVGWRTPAASLATGTLLLLAKSWEYADGKIDHDILIVIAPLLLAFSGWGGAWSVDARSRPVPAPRRPRPSWPLALMAFAIGLAMFSAGAIKVLTGWLDPAVHATYGHLVFNTMVTGRETWLSGVMLASDAAWLWEPADWSITLLEVGFLGAMLHPRILRIALSLGCLFHLAVWLLFDIVFVANVVAYAAFVPWWTLASRFAAPRPAFAPPRRVLYAGCAAAMAVGLAGLAVGEPPEARLGLQLQEAVVLAGAATGAAYLLRALLPRGPLPRVQAGPDPSVALPSP
jgi:hypothetical protein